MLPRDPFGYPRSTWGAIRMPGGIGATVELYWCDTDDPTPAAADRIMSPEGRGVIISDCMGRRAGTACASDDAGPVDGSGGRTPSMGGSPPSHAPIPFMCPLIANYRGGCE